MGKSKNTKTNFEEPIIYKGKPSKKELKKVAELIWDIPEEPVKKNKKK